MKNKITFINFRPSEESHINDLVESVDADIYSENGDGKNYLLDLRIRKSLLHRSYVIALPKGIDVNDFFIEIHNEQTCQYNNHFNESTELLIYKPNRGMKKCFFIMTDEEYERRYDSIQID